MLRLLNDIFWSVLPRPDQLEAITQQLEREIAAQAQTQHQVEKYRSIFENAAEGIFQTTADGRYLSVNPALARMYGYASPQDLIAHLTNLGQQLYVDPQRRTAFIQALERQRSITNFESQVYRQDGGIIWISENARAVRDAHGQLLYYEGAVQDITERKQAEAALRHSEIGFALAADGASDGIWDWDIQTGNTYFSSRWKQFLGYKDDEIANRVETWEQSLHPDDVERVMATLNAYLQRQIPTYEVEFRALHKEGVYRWIRARGAALWDKTGKPYRMAGSHTDITERKQQEEALQLIFEGTASKIGDDFFHACTCYLAKVLQVRYAIVSKFANEAKTRVQALAFWNGEEWADGIEYDIAFTPCEEVLKGAMQYYPENLQTYFPGPNIITELEAESFWGIPLITSTGEVIGHLATLDVKPMSQGPDQEQILRIFAARTTAELERKQAEVNLQQAKEAAETANRAKSRFLANMSHELRTPLNAILGFTQVISRDPSLNPHHQESLGIINRSGEHLLALINDVLEMAKIEAGQITLNSRAFDLHRLLSNLQEMLRCRAEAKGLKLIFEDSPEVPQYVRTDEGKLRQVLINLLGNAIKFTQQGQVTLRLMTENQQSVVSNQQSVVGIGSRGDGEMGNASQPSTLCPLSATLSSPFHILVFEIEDTGAGIELDQDEALFDAFVQTETGRQSQEGTGLGLAISRQFVRLMGGDIRVSSVLGRGTIFRFDIRVEPVQQTTDLATTPVHRKVIGLAPNQPVYRILVVEDNRLNRLALVKLLKSCGFQVQEASNGHDAIALWRSWRPDLIWMDIRMPRMDGCEATERIKAEAQEYGGDGEMGKWGDGEAGGDGKGQDKRSQKLGVSGQLSANGLHSIPQAKSKIQNPKSKIPSGAERSLSEAMPDKAIAPRAINPKSKIQNPKSKIQNPKSKIQNPLPPIIIALTASAFEEDRATILAAGCDDIVNKPFRQTIIFDKMAHYLGVRYLYQDQET